MSYLREDVHSHRVPLEPPHLLSPAHCSPVCPDLPVEGPSTLPFSNHGLPGSPAVPSATLMEPRLRVHLTHGHRHTGTLPGLLKDDPCQQPVLGLGST